MARLTPVQRKLAKLRREKGLRKKQPLSFASRFDKITQNVEIPDINYGAWSFIDQEYAPDYPGRKFDFI